MSRRKGKAIPNANTHDIKLVWDYEPGNKVPTLLNLTMVCPVLVESEPLSSSGFSGTAGSGAQPQRSRASCRLEFLAIEQLDGLGPPREQDRIRARSPRDLAKILSRNSLSSRALLEQFRQLPARRGSGFGVQLRSCLRMRSNVFYHWPGSRRCASEAPRRTASAASTDFTFGIVPPENASRASSVSAPMARRSASISLSSVRSAKKIFRVSFSSNGSFLVTDQSRPQKPVPSNIPDRPSAPSSA